MEQVYESAGVNGQVQPSRPNDTRFDDVAQR